MLRSIMPWLLLLFWLGMGQAAFGQEATDMPDSPWMRERPRRMMTGMHTPDYDQLSDAWHALHDAGKVPGVLEAFDADALVAAVKAAGVQAFWIYSKGGGGNTFCPTEVGHMLSALEGRDLFGELCDKLVDADITPLCVYEVASGRHKQEHPEWCSQPVEMLRGERDDMDFAGPCCWASGYGDYVIEQMREVLTRYPIKAIYLDCVGGGARGGDWQTPELYRRFREEFGFDFPGLAGLTHEQYVRYYRWRMKLIEAYLDRARRVTRELRPDVAFTYNYVGIPGPADFVTCDLFPFSGGTLGAESLLRRNAALSRNGPGEVLFDGCTSGSGLLPQGVDGFRAQCWTARALGVAVCTGWSMPMDGRLVPRRFELTRKIFAEQAPFEEYLACMEPVATIGIVNSHDSRKFRPGDKAKMALNQKENEGWAQAAIADGRLWDYLDEYLLTPEHLRRFETLILGNASCLSDEHADLVRAFVRDGGTLILSGETSLFDQDGRRRPDLALADVAGGDGPPRSGVLPPHAARRAGRGRGRRP